MLHPTPDPVQKLATDIHKLCAEEMQNTGLNMDLVMSALSLVLSTIAVTTEFPREEYLQCSAESYDIAVENARSDANEH